MKFGEMKYDVPFEKIKNHHWDFNPLQEFMIELEGKRLINHILNIHIYKKIHG